MNEIYIVGKRGWSYVDFAGDLPYNEVLGFFINQKDAIKWVEQQSPKLTSEYYYSKKVQNLNVS